MDSINKNTSPLKNFDSRAWTKVQQEKLESAPLPSESFVSQTPNKFQKPNGMWDLEALAASALKGLDPALPAPETASPSTSPAEVMAPLSASVPAPLVSGNAPPASPKLLNELHDGWPNFEFEKTPPMEIFGSSNHTSHSLFDDTGGAEFLTESPLNAKKGDFPQQAYTGKTFNETLQSIMADLDAKKSAASASPTSLGASLDENKAMAAYAKISDNSKKLNQLAEKKNLSSVKPFLSAPAVAGGAVMGGAVGALMGMGAGLGMGGLGAAGLMLHHAIAASVASGAPISQSGGSGPVEWPKENPFEKFANIVETEAAAPKSATKSKADQWIHDYIHGTDLAPGESKKVVHEKIKIFDNAPSLNAFYSSKNGMNYGHQEVVSHESGHSLLHNKVDLNSIYNHESASIDWGFNTGPAASWATEALEGTGPAAEIKKSVQTKLQEIGPLKNSWSQPSFKVDKALLPLIDKLGMDPVEFFTARACWQGVATKRRAQLEAVLDQYPKLPKDKKDVKSAIAAAEASGTHLTPHDKYFISYFVENRKNMKTLFRSTLNKFEGKEVTAYRGQSESSEYGKHSTKPLGCYSWNPSVSRSWGSNFKRFKVNINDIWSTSAVTQNNHKNEQELTVYSRGGTRKGTSLSASETVAECTKYNAETKKSQIMKDLNV